MCHNQILEWFVTSNAHGNVEVSSSQEILSALDLREPVPTADKAMSEKEKIIAVLSATGAVRGSVARFIPDDGEFAPSLTMQAAPRRKVHHYCKSKIGSRKTITRAT